MTFAELIAQIDLWKFDITLYVLMQFEAIEQDQRDCKTIQKSLNEYEPDDRQWTVIHMQLIKKQAQLLDDCFLALWVAHSETRFVAANDGKGTFESLEPVWTMTDATQFATLRQKWLPYVKKAREINQKEIERYRLEEYEQKEVESDDHE
jgi:hypothetical protein